MDAILRPPPAQSDDGAKFLPERLDLNDIHLRQAKQHG